MAACVSCSNPLVHAIADYSDDDEGHLAGSSKTPAAEPDTVPDDVQLACGEHFHWDCLIESYNSPGSCPSCSYDVSSISSTGLRQLLVNLNNEGGVQMNLDILPLLSEEYYLRNHPEDRVCRAFLELCREGDIVAIVNLLETHDDPEYSQENDPTEPRRSVHETLRYQDPLAEMQSALHAAVTASQPDVVYLLLLLAANVPELRYPGHVLQEAAALAPVLSAHFGGVDIRILRDSRGRTAEDIAAEIGGVWQGWIGNGHLAI